MDCLPFKEPAECSAIQLMVLTLIYGAILFYSADMIGTGSEYLLLVPSLAKLVGSVVLPILGAVPDGMMVLFSGTGDKAQTEVAVGVGALAGSTIMLLTIPWFLAIYAGRVNIIDGKPRYFPAPKLDPPNYFDWNKTGVSVGPLIRTNGILMLLTALSYLVVQIPAMMGNKPGLSMEQRAESVNFPALIGLVICLIFFAGYLYMQIDSPDDKQTEENTRENKVVHCQVEAIRRGKITVRGALYGALEDGVQVNQNQSTSQKRSSEVKLLSKTDQTRIKKLLKPFFQYYDTNRDNTLERVEFGKIMKDLNENMTQEEEDKLFKSMDWDNSNSIDFEEFAELMVRYAKGEVGRPLYARSVVKPQRFSARGAAEGNSQISMEEEEEDEMPEDLVDLTPEEQQARIKVRAFWMMSMGTLMVLIFSDPAVNTLQEIGDRLNVNSFYISFILAPIASNASEMVAATNYGLKKTKKMMTISLSTLLGAACMNNTFCLSIFFAIVYFRKLAWTFSAEVLSIIIGEVWVGYFAISSSVHTLKKGFLVLSCYPMALILVYVLENFFGWD